MLYKKTSRYGKERRRLVAELTRCDITITHINLLALLSFKNKNLGPIFHITT